MPALVWFRNDLRLADNPVLNYAIQQHGTVVPAFPWTPGEERWRAMAALDRVRQA